MHTQSPSKSSTSVRILQIKAIAFIFTCIQHFVLKKYRHFQLGSHVFRKVRCVVFFHLKRFSFLEFFLKSTYYDIVNTESRNFQFDGAGQVYKGLNVREKCVVSEKSVVRRLKKMYSFVLIFCWSYRFLCCLFKNWLKSFKFLVITYYHFIFKSSKNLLLSNSLTTQYRYFQLKSLD